MKEVSCKALGMFFRRAEAEDVPVSRLLAGVPYDLKHLQNKQERIDWSAFCVFMENANRIWTDEQLADLGGAFIKGPFFKAFAVVARLLFTPGTIYRFMNKADSGAGNQMFSCIRPTHIEVGPNHVVLEMRLPADYPHSHAFWVTTKGGLAAIPQLMALRPAKVELTETEWGATYDIVYPKGGAALAFVIRFFSWPFTIRSAGRELKEANEALMARYAELEDARAVLALQATQLSVAHTISGLIHGDLDIDRTVDAVVDALVNVGGFVAAEVNLSVPADGNPLEIHATRGLLNESEPIASVLQSRGRTIGQVKAWMANDQDARERSQLLEFVLPTLSMALDNAISYRELTDYRQALEIKVEQRTAELVHARDALAQSVRSLEAAQQVRDRIFQNINHEIRTPLTLIHLAVSDLKQRFQPKLDTRAIQELDGIEISTRKLLRLVDDLLIVAAGHEGKLQLRITPVDLARMLELVVATWRPSAEQKSLSLTFNGPGSCVRNVDEEKLERVVTNLISNALKFTPSGGSIQVDLRENAEGVSIAVRDTGIGIDDDLKKRLFGRFEQGRPAVHAGARGSGIGLSIVKELTEAHGGDVSVESLRGGGSVFRIVLPTGAQPRALITTDGDSGSSAPLRLLPADFDGSRAAIQLPRVLEAEGPARATILVAEDDPMLAEAIGRLLQKEYRIILAGDGLTALRMAQQHMPDILVSDVGMPGMDGLELTRRFRELPGNRLAPVVLLTAFANLSDRLQGFGAGAIDYVIKPFEPAELLARIHSQLELRSLALRLHQSEKLASLGTLSAGLAHEMRNPANAIVNAIEPLSELLPPELRHEDHPVAQLVGVLRECALHIAMLSRQLLGFKRPGELDYQASSVADVISRAHALTSPLFKSVELREELTYKGPLDCAAPLLTQVLSNLLENGAHAAGNGGWVKLHSRLDGDRAVLEVSDSGKGVPVELRERIFEPFFTTKPPGSGTGLGLTMARQIVERHCGILEVREAPGGTLFHIEVPVRAERGASQRHSGGGR